MAPSRYRCAPILSMLLACAGLMLAPHHAPAQGNVANGLQQGFPQLDRQFKVIDRPAQNYNCIAHTLGMHDRWIDPQTGPANAPLSLMDKMYGSHGYQRTPALDLQLKPGQQRVALYGKVSPDGTIKQITHAALQEADGGWTSKLGHLPLIRHASPYAVDGPMYGVPVATYVRNVGGANNGGNLAAPPAANANPSSFRNGLSQVSNAPHHQGSKHSGLFAGAMQSAGRNFGSNSSPASGFESNGFARSSVGNGASSFARSGVRINGGIHMHGGFGDGMNIEAFAGAGNGSSFTSSGIRINGGIHSHSGFVHGFHEAGMCCCNKNDGNFHNGQFANSGNVKSGANNSSNFSNLGNAKSAGNSLNTLAANQGVCKNFNGGAKNVGNAKIAGNSLNALVNNGQVRNAGNGLAGNNRIGSMPGSILVNINGDHNKVNINFGVAKTDSGPAANNASAKNGPANNSLAKNAGNARNPTSNVGNVKNAGITGNVRNAANAKNAGNTLNTLVRNTSSKNTSNVSLGANQRVGSSPGAVLVNINGNDNKVRINAGAPMPGAKNGIGCLVGNKAAANQAPLNAKNGIGGLAGNKTAANQAPLNAKNGIGGLVGNKIASNNNTGMPPLVKTAAPNNKQGVGNLVGNKQAVQNRPAAVAKNVPVQPVAPAGNARQNAGTLIAKAAPAQFKSAVSNTANLGQAKHSPVANNVAVKSAPQRQAMPAVAKNTPVNPFQALTAHTRGGMGSVMTQSRPTQMPRRR